jgi:phenylalanine-4-hydroxylase
MAPFSAPRIPEGPLSAEVEFKAQTSIPIKESTSPEGTIGEEIVSPVYSDEQNHTWTALFERQGALLENRVCDEYLHARDLLNLPASKVPALADVSRNLFRLSGWKVIRVAGYVPEPIFFKLLANKCFPCTDFLRHPSEIEYTPAPDMFHDIVGHLPLFVNKRFAEFFHLWGIAGLNAKTEEEVAWLGRIYWYTVEFGLINPTVFKGTHRDPAQCRVYGAGISSSVGEIPHSLSPSIEKRPFQIEVVEQTTFDIHHMQDFYFEIESFDQLDSDFTQWALSKGLLTKHNLTSLGR